MSRGLKLCLAVLLLMFSIACLGRESWLLALGRYLAETHVPDVVVVPAADYLRADVSTETLEHAARLVREGHVRHIVMSCAEVYGVGECNSRRSRCETEAGRGRRSIGCRQNDFRMRLRQIRRSDI
jgi:hypothetical protein